MVQEVDKAAISEAAHKFAKLYSLDVKLVEGIIRIESAFNKRAIRYEPGYRYTLNPQKFAKLNRITADTEQKLQMFSWGLMQVMGGTARENGFEGSLLKLAEIETSIEQGCRHLAKLWRKYQVVDDVVAAYNAGSPRKTSTGQYMNQSYVDKFHNQDV